MPGTGEQDVKRDGLTEIDRSRQNSFGQKDRSTCRGRNTVTHSEARDEQGRQEAELPSKGVDSCLLQETREEGTEELDTQEGEQKAKTEPRR